MATMPDITSSDILAPFSVGTIYYFNIVDSVNYSLAAGEVDPTNVLSYEKINEYQQHDNGVELLLEPEHGFTGNSSIQLYARVKTDGWMVVGSTQNESTQLDVQNSELDNHMGILASGHTSRPGGLGNLNCTSAMANMATLLDPAASGGEFDPTNGGFYSPKYSNATNIQVAAISGGNTTVSYPETITRYSHMVFGNQFDFEDGSGNRITVAGGNGHLDIIGDGIMPDPGVVHEIYNTSGQFGDNQTTNMMLFA